MRLRPEVQNDNCTNRGKNPRTLSFRAAGFRLIGAGIFLASILCPSNSWGQSSTAAAPGSGTSGARLALVIGNGDYQHAPHLANPVNDATDVAATLKDLGFQVTLVKDGSNAQMARSLHRFADNVSKTHAAAALFYYAGHGVQFQGVNYLIPVNADIHDSYDLRDQALSADRVTSELAQANPPFSLIVLDACRDDPFPTGGRGVERGLSVMQANASGTILLFSTGPNQVAQDGKGANSPFAKAFTENITAPNVNVIQTIIDVQRSVKKLTKGVQIPYVTSSFTGTFFFSTARDQLARSERQSQTLKSELATLDAQIAKRQAAIANAQNAEEKQRLETEQQHAKVLEAAKRLEAQRMTDLRKQAEEALAAQRSQEALRQQMTQKLQAEQVSLTERAQARRAELERLNKQTIQGAGFYQRLETIAKMQSAIADINSRFDTTIKNTLSELEGLHKKNVAAFVADNKQDPWETPEEYKQRINKGLADLNGKYEDDRLNQKKELENKRLEETAELKLRLAQAEKDLNGMRFTAGAALTHVDVGRFDAYTKRFPIDIHVTDTHVPFQMATYYQITGHDRDTLSREYYRVFSADQAGGLSATVQYAIYEVYPNIWAVRPVQTKVLDLLENDAVLVSAKAPVPGSNSREWDQGSDSVVSSGGGEFLFETDGTVKHVAAVVPVKASAGYSARVTVDGKDLGDTDTLYVALTPHELGPRRFEYRWPNGDHTSASVDVVRGINAPLIVSPDDGAETGAGTLIVTGLPPDATVSVEGTPPAPQSNTPSYVATFDSNGPEDLVVTSRWIASPFWARIASGPLPRPVVWVDMSMAKIPLIGRIELTGGNLVAGVFDRTGRQVVSDTQMRPAKNGSGYDIPVSPGAYEIGLRQPQDNYWSRIENVTVKAAHEVDLQIGQVDLSAGYQLEQLKAARAAIEPEITKKGWGEGIGWSLLAVAVAGVAGSIYSYLEAQAPIAAYGGATLTSVAEQTRAEVTKWANLFGVGLGAGVGGSAVGATLLGVFSGRHALVEKHKKLERQIAALNARFAERAAENPLYANRIQSIPAPSQQAPAVATTERSAQSQKQKVYAIGDKGPAGGIVFYDKGHYSDGWRYLEAAPNDQSNGIQWGGYLKKVGGTKTAIGTGKANTERIVKAMESSGYAAKLCLDLTLGGYSDWFLPSKDGLNEMYKEKGIIGGFAPGNYWSSSEYSAGSAWGEDFYNGIQYYVNLKHNYSRVRAVRAF